MIHDTMVISNINIFQVKSHPMALLRLSLTLNNGTPAINVPAGQTHLQKYGSPPARGSFKIIGNSITNTTNIPYFKNLSFLKAPFTLYLGDGILYNNSCIRPNGHNQPQTNRPSVILNNNNRPTTYVENLYLTLPKTAWSDPIGQEPIAPGQE